MWSKSHEKERKFNLDKQKARRYLLKLGYIFFWISYPQVTPNQLKIFFTLTKTGHLGLQAFKEGVSFKNPKRLAKDLAEAEKATKTRRLDYLKSVAQRNLSR